MEAGNPVAGNISAFQTRTPGDDPWCWQSKRVLKAITEVFGESNQAASARSVYLALTELASDEQMETFTAAKALIAHKAGVSVKTAETRLKGLVELGAVRIEPQRGTANSGVIKASNKYTLIAMRNGYALTMRNEGRQGSVSDKVEESEKNEKESEERMPKLSSMSEIQNGEAEEFKEEWNNNIPGDSKITILSSASKSKLAVNLKSQEWRDNWKKAIKRMAKSDFCTGKVKPLPGKNAFRMSVAFFLKPDTVAKIMEGEYDNGRKTSALDEYRKYL